MTYEDLEAAVIKALGRAVPGLRSVEPYEGQLEGELEKLALRLPAAYVVHGGSEFERVDGATYRERAVVTVLLAQRVRGAEPADRTVLEGALGALANLSVGESAERLAPRSRELLFTNRLVAVHALEFKAYFDRDFENA